MTGYRWRGGQSVGVWSGGWSEARTLDGVKAAFSSSGYRFGCVERKGAGGSFAAYGQLMHMRNAGPHHVRLIRPVS